MQLGLKAGPHTTFYLTGKRLQLKRNENVTVLLRPDIPSYLTFYLTVLRRSGKRLCVDSKARSVLPYVLPDSSRRSGKRLHRLDKTLQVKRNENVTVLLRPHGTMMSAQVSLSSA